LKAIRYRKSIFLLYNMFMHCPKVIVKKSRIPKAGYGVFAAKNIKPGELLETAPFVEVPYGIVYNQPNILQYYVFESHLKPKHLIVVFGTGSMYNTSKNPNAYPQINERDPDRLLDYVAVKPIRKGEEIFIDYGRDTP